MDSRERQNKMLEFIAALPDSVRQSFKARNDFDVLIAISDIGDKFELTIDEIHWLYEAVRRVLAGEDSPSNLVAFISEDERIEEDNRPKIPAIAQEIQRQIFDVALPILRQAGMEVKEGRIGRGVSVERLAVSKEGEGHISIPQKSIVSVTSLPSTTVPSPSELNATRYPPPPVGGVGLHAALDERHLRALARIAAGTNYSEERLIEEFHTLPEGLRRAITTVDTANAIQEIAKKFLLHIDQMAALASETGLVLLGLTHPRDFVKNLARRLRISETRALEIAREVSEQILGKVREALRGLHESPPIQNTKYQIPKNQPQASQIANQKTQEPPKKLGMLEEQKEKIPSSLNANRYTLNASATPYSPSAKWETGEETPTREEVLRGIERPNEIVGPTGWRKQVSESTKSPNVRMAANEERMSPKPPAPLSPTTPPSPPQPRRGEEEKSFLEEKLAGPMGAVHTERRYTIDPYREPME